MTEGQSKEEAYVASLNIVESEKWILYPSYSEGRLVHFHIGGIPPEYKPQWLVSAAVEDAQDWYSVITDCDRSPAHVGFWCESESPHDEERCRWTAG